MDERRVKRIRKPTFFWQGVLILAPMLILAKLGALAIWQDKRLAHQQAEVRAQEVAEEAADALARELQSFREKLTNPVVMFRDGWWPSTNKGIVKQLDPDDGTLQIQVNSANELIWPPPYDSPPVPNLLRLDRLTEEQRILWLAVRAKAAANRSDSSVAEDYRRFLATAPPTNFIAVASLARGEALLRAETPRSRTDARLCFVTLTNYFRARTEAGLPVRPLAAFKMFETTMEQDVSPNLKHADFLAAYRETLSVLLSEPSVLTSALLHEAAAAANRVRCDYAQSVTREAYTARAQREWADQEMARAIYAAASHSFEGRRSAHDFNLGSLPLVGGLFVKTNSPTVMWISVPPPENPETNDSVWLITMVRHQRGTTWLCRPETDVKQRIANVLQHIRKPEYLAASVRLADHDVISSNHLMRLEHVSGGKGGGQFWKERKPDKPLPVLATATREDSGFLLSVAFHLVSPDLLYAQQKERTVWFGLLIGVSTLASIIGFLSAWRAFHKQLRLAELKSNFVSSVSHELRAPIASVRLMAEGLERGKISDPTKQQEYFRFITQECRRLSSMIENVLDFARIEQGRKQYEFEPTDVTALVEQTVKLMEPYAAERGVKLRNEEGGFRRVESENNTVAAHSGFRTPRSAVIDGQTIQQALVNLLDNAIKHSPSGSEVIVALTFHDSSHAIHISVTDCGPGIPPPEHEKIFERFYRLGSELRRETPGVGIGLSIVKHVVEAHGGRVRVESEIGQGSRFIIELPFTTEGQRHRE